MTGTFLVMIVERMTHSLFYASWSWIIVGIAVIPSSYLWSSLAQKYGTTRTLTFCLYFTNDKYPFPRSSFQMFSDHF
ncbi:YbfB/YjiJ family MFS transporter [Bacillus cytotoxicus]